MNPCGRAVDWGRRPYTTKARLHNDPAAPLVDLIWYETELPFQDTESVINSLDWDEEPWRPRVVGEVYGASRAYNGLHRIPGLNGLHQCGNPADFAQGAPWPHTGPITIYDKDHIPTCCGRALVAFVASAARPAAINQQVFNLVGSVKSAARPAALVYPPDLAEGNVTSGARPAATVKVYCDTYTFNCNGAVTVVWNTVTGILDSRWLNPSAPDAFRWIFLSPHVTGTPGLFRLLWRRFGPLPTFETWQTLVPWNGRGTSPTFFRLGGTPSPEKCASCVITCAD